MADGRCEIGMIGLGTMGANLLLNMADHGFPVVGFDINAEKRQALADQAKGRDVAVAADMPALVAALRQPRAVILLVPAGKIVDQVVAQVAPLFAPGDIIIDGGNSHYTDTNRRIDEMKQRGLDFVGLGVSGGEAGARHGPSLMPGGSPQAFERIRPVLEAAAAKVDGEPCVTWLGGTSAGHYVKMVHNGIEYAIMQMIAETYDLMDRGLGLTHRRLAAIYGYWNERQRTFLLEITARIFERMDEKTGLPLVAMVLDAARQLGTGSWTSEDAMALQSPIPSIDMAVSMRCLSAATEERAALGKSLGPRQAHWRGKADGLVDSLGNALEAATLIAFGQGMSLLRRASQQYGYGLRLAEVARIWRGGCIIRAGVLNEIRDAYVRNPDLPNLLADKDLARSLLTREGDLRLAVQAAVDLGIPAPSLMSALAYLDSFRSERLPANLIQAQRDYFGAHLYERIDEPGKQVHSDWEKVTSVANVK